MATQHGRIAPRSGEQIWEEQRPRLEAYVQAIKPIVGIGVDIEWYEV
jgi:hypothetical protein